MSRQEILTPYIASASDVVTGAAAQHAQMVGRKESLKEEEDHHKRWCPNCQQETELDIFFEAGAVECGACKLHETFDLFLSGTCGKPKYGKTGK